MLKNWNSEINNENLFKYNSIKIVLLYFGGFIMTDVSAGVEYKINVDGNSFLLDSKKYNLLVSILETGSLTAAAKEINVSYRTALNYIDKIESTLDVKVVSTTKGGKGGGGGTSLTAEGYSI